MKSIKYINPVVRNKTPIEVIIKILSVRSNLLRYSVVLGAVINLNMERDFDVSKKLYLPKDNLIAITCFKLGAINP